MIFRKTDIEGVTIIEPELRGDERGFFYRNFCAREFREVGLPHNIVNINRSYNKTRGTIRGFHFQYPPNAEDKIVQCVRGALYDIALDIRKGSPTYGEYVAEELTPENRKMLLVPKGFAHGIQTLADDTELIYFVTEFYAAKQEGGIRWNDPFFKIEWPLGSPTVISDKDSAWPLVDPKNLVKITL